MKKLLRILIAIASFILLCWFIAPFFWGIWHIGCIFGIVLSALAFFRTAFAGSYHRIKEKCCKHKLTKLIFRLIQIAAALVVIYGIAISALMVYAMIPWESNDNATAVVLGAQVKPWGPSPLLRQRIDAAEEYLKQHPDANAVVTGGKGDNEPTTEADSMYDNMVKDGIDKKRIYKEDKATNTDENIRYSLDVIKANGLNSDISIVSDSYHQLRARIIAHKYNSALKITPVNTTNTYIAGIAAYPSYFVREWLAIPVELLKQ